MPYIGTPAVDRFTSTKAASVYSGDGSTVAFTLEHSVGSDEDILVSVDGVIQEPSVAYAVSSGTTLTFTAAPSSNSGNNIFVYYLFRTIGTVTHPPTSALSATSGTFSTTLGVTGNTTVGGTLGVTGEATFSAAALARGAVVQRQYVSLTSTTQLTRAGGLAELSTSLRIAFTPKHANSVLYAEVSAFFVSPNSTNLIYAQVYDVTNSTVPSVPPSDGSRLRVHFAKRTTPSDANDFDMMNFIVPIAATNTSARTYTLFVGTEGSTLQFLSSTLSTAVGANSPITFSITEIYNP